MTGQWVTKLGPILSRYQILLWTKDILVSGDHVDDKSGFFCTFNWELYQ